MAYRTETIGPERSGKLAKAASEINLYSSKADINGICVELHTANKDYLEMWTDNFYHMSDRVRAMISLAHPDFRDQLTQEAKDAGLL